MKKSNIEKHPIQLKEITVHKLAVTVNDHMTAIDYQGPVSMQMAIGRSEFSSEDSSVSIGLQVKVRPSDSEKPDLSSGENEEISAFILEVDIQGHFIVDIDKFQQKHIESWSKNNAPFLLLPYVREHIYGLASRAGIRGLILPLFIQPGTERAKNSRNTDK